VEAVLFHPYLIWGESSAGVDARKSESRSATAPGAATAVVAGPPTNTAPVAASVQSTAPSLSATRGTQLALGGHPAPDWAILLLLAVDGCCHSPTILILLH
jgi:hypothetical protein